jgi:predicted acylesterase/phospholipase RssA
MMRLFSYLASILAVGLFAAGCATPAANPVRPETLALGKPVDLGNVERRNRRHLLALSSGGADGAFGAGVLVGWTESGSRPVFDIVSGVSTGALQAPLAFLGARFDPLLAGVYTETRTDDVFDGNGIGSLIKAGLSDAEPLRRMLDRIVTPDILHAIAAEHTRGRRLYVTTTDLTEGRSVMWDMGRLAASRRPDARRAFIEILVASASPPGFVEPVPLTDAATGKIHLHADGGLERPIAVDEGMLRPRHNDTLWVIANGHVSRSSALRLASTDGVTVARRGVTQVLRSHLYGTVERAEQLARRHQAGFRLQRIPSSQREANNPLRFEPTEMRRLFELGRTQGRNPATWLETVAATDP